MDPSAISHLSLKTPDWLSIKLQAPEVAAVSLKAILTAYDPIEKQVFALRGMAMLLIEERELFRYSIDPEVGDNYVSFDRWLKDTCPNSWSYCRDALRAVKELKAEIPFADMLEIKRCNIELLKNVSSGVRALPEVIAAAKKMPEKDFVAEMNKRGQHLEVREPVLMVDKGVCVVRDEAVQIAKLVFHVQTDGEALEAIYADFVMAHREDAAIEQEQATA